MNKISTLALALALTANLGIAHADEQALLNWFMEDEQSLLEEGLTDLEAELTDSQTQYTTLETEFQAAQDSLTDPDADTAAIEQTISDLEAQMASLLAAQAELQNQIDATNSAYDEELAIVTEQISALTEKQIKALTHALNTTNSNGIELQLDSEQIATIVDNDYSFQQTNLLLKSYTEEAKFLSKAEALRAEYEATGDEELLKEAEKMEEIAAMKAERFENLASGHPAKSEDANKEERKTKRADNKPNNVGSGNKPAKPNAAGTANKGKRN